MFSCCVEKPSPQPQTPAQPLICAYPAQPQTNVSNLKIERQTNKYFYRPFNSCNNTELRLDGLRNCTVFLLDLVKAITVDDCEDCEFVFVGCSGSIFIRDTKNCSIAAITVQFRARNLKNSHVFLYSKTDPIIESSDSLTFTPFLLSYVEQFASEVAISQLSQQIAKISEFLNIDIFVNKFNKIYDFTPATDPHFVVKYLPDPQDKRPPTIYMVDNDIMEVAERPLSSNAQVTCGMPVCGYEMDNVLSCDVNLKACCTLGFAVMLFKQLGVIIVGKNKFVATAQKIDLQTLNEVIKQLETQFQ